MEMTTLKELRVEWEDFLKEKRLDAMIKSKEEFNEIEKLQLVNWSFGKMNWNDGDTLYFEIGVFEVVVQIEGQVVYLTCYQDDSNETQSPWLTDAFLDCTEISEAKGTLFAYRDVFEEMGDTPESDLLSDLFHDFELAKKIKELEDARLEAEKEMRKDNLCNLKSHRLRKEMGRLY